MHTESIREFTVSPPTVTVGQPVTFSGTGCPPMDKVNVGFGSGSTTSGTTAGRVQPNAAGDWTVTTRVGDSTPLGSQNASASCLPPPYNYVGALDYRAVTVVVDSFRGLSVAPTSVPAGSAITVTPTAPCDSGFPAGIQVEVATSAGNIFTDQPIDGPASVVFAARDLDANGNWTQVLVVPANTTPATYYVNAACAGPSRSYNAFYTPVSIDVLSPQAANPGSPESEIPRTR